MSEAATEPKPAQETSFYLPKNPETQARINKLFVDSGLAKRALGNLHKVKAQNEPLLTWETSECNFGVYQAPTLDLKGVELVVVVEFPNPDPISLKETPRVEMYQTFNTKQLESKHEPQLTIEQQRVIEEAFQLQKAEELPVA